MSVPFVPCLNVAQFEMVYQEESQRVENVFHVHRIGTSWDATALTTMCGTLATWFAAHLNTFVSTGVSLVLIVATDLTSKMTPRVEYTSGLPAAGADASTKLPNNATFAVSWRTPFRGRSYRGRSYHIGLTQNDVTGSVLKGPSVVTLTAAYTALLTAINVGGYEMVVTSKRQDGNWLANGISTPILNCTINANLASQRRRLIGRGQ